MMQPFVDITGTAVPLLVDDVNTDQIAPAVFGRSLHPDYAKMLFGRWRWHADGSPVPDFVLNQPQFRSPAILVAGANFGAGSSRESAVWSMVSVGIRCIVARSFADIYRENCLQNGVLPVVLPAAGQAAFEAMVLAADGAVPFTADLRAQIVSRAGGPDFAFEIEPAERTALLEGLDNIGMTLQHIGAIHDWESRTRQATPWLQAATDRRPAAQKEI